MVLKLARRLAAGDLLLYRYYRYIEACVKWKKNGFDASTWGTSESVLQIECIVWQLTALTCPLSSAMSSTCINISQQQLSEQSVHLSQRSAKTLDLYRPDDLTNGCFVLVHLPELNWCLFSLQGISIVLHEQKRLALSFSFYGQQAVEDQQHRVDPNSLSRISLK